jgi:arylsulfatase A-like enzyme
LGGDTDQWHPDLTHDNHPVTPPARPEDGYHLNIDLADRAIGFITASHENAPDKPFFLYFATGAGHAPHHVEKTWIEKYAGAFDMGWDAYREIVFGRQQALGLLPSNATLPERDPDVPVWESLSADAKRMYARQMETYAGFLEQTDHHFGRILEFLERTGRLDDTLILAVSDNGASAEGGVHGTFNDALFFNGVPERLEDNLKHYDDWGGPETFCHYAWGWTAAGDTPFRRWKRETYRGGVTDPCIVHWPKGISASGEVRRQYIHAIDIVPTVLDALGLDPPETLQGVTQSPIHGVSFAHTFDDGEAASRHHTQYFEMFGHRSLYHEGWKAVCPFPGPSFAEAAEKNRFFGMPLTAELLDDLDANGWELYHLESDHTECRNVAAEHPETAREMIQRWYTEAGRYGVLPLATADLQRMNAERPSVARPREHYEYFGGGDPIAFASAPRVYNRPHSITADVVTKDGEEGVLLTQGSRNAGYALFIKDRHLHYVHNYVGLEVFDVVSSEPVPSGEVRLRYEFEPTGEPNFREGKGSPGRAQLYINDKLVANVGLPHTTPSMFGVLGLSCGYAAYDSVMPDAYEAPFAFSGEIRRVVLDVSGDLINDDEADLKRFLTVQ